MHGDGVGVEGAGVGALSDCEQFMQPGEFKPSTPIQTLDLK